MWCRRLFLPLLSALLTVPSGAVLACPNPDLGAFTQLRSNGASLRMGQSRRATGGGAVTLDACPGVALRDVPPMMFSDAPSMTADLSGMLGLAMEIKADGPCAAGLLVRTTKGEWYYDDGGRGPGLPWMMLRQPGTGQLQIWIGTPDGEVCRTRINLMTYPAFN